METNQQTLINFFKNFKESIKYDDFYSISYTKNDIRLQGEFNTSLAQRLNNIGFDCKFDSYLIFTCKNDKELFKISIVLT